jgi:DNA modification methylase
MAALPDRSFDLAIADPPYNVSKGGTWQWDNSVDLPGFGGDWTKTKEDWDDFDLPGYMAFTRAWLGEIQRLVRPSGSIWIHGTYHNIGLINFVMQMLGIEIINEIVWFKRNSFPNLSGRRLTASHETILWAHTGRGKRTYYFDYEHAKALECPEDRIKAGGKQMRTVWDIPNNKARDELACGKHPAQKPLRLLDRMLAIAAPPAGRLLVPFAGAGSECVAAVRRGLSFVAFEKDPTFAKIARGRLALEAKARPLPAREPKP